MSLVLSLDLGTSGCRSAVFDSALNMLSAARTDYSPDVLSEKEVEQDANRLWDSVRHSVCEAVSRLGKDSARLKSICISSQGITIIPVDQDGEPLCKAISWLDGRAEAETEALKQQFGVKEIFEKTGKRISSLYTLPKLIWMKKNRPDVFRRAYKFLLPLDFIQYKLCGNYITDHSMAAGTMLYGIRRQDWLDSLLHTAGIDREKLSGIAFAGSAAGIVKQDIARELGLPDGMMVAVGAQDQKCAAYGGGVSGTVVTVSLGTGSCITKLTPVPALNGQMHIPVFSWLHADCWDMEGVINTAGSALEWFRDKFAQGKGFSELSSAAESADSGDLKFYPYLSGGSSPHWGNVKGMFAGLSLNSGIAECTRAIMEGVAYNIKANIDIMDNTGTPAQTLHVFGGGAKSDLWCDCIANITEKRVVRLESCETALAGAAKLAFCSLGQETRPLREEKEFRPRKRVAEEYKEKYKKYEAMRKCCFDAVQEEGKE